MLVSSCSLYGASSSIRISQFINFEAGSNGEVIDDTDSDTNTWNSFTFGANKGGWAIRDPNGTHTITLSTTGQKPLLRQVNLTNSSSFTEVGSTRSFKQNDSASQLEYLQYFLKSPLPNKVTWGFYLTTEGWTFDGNFYDLSGSEAFDGEFLVLAVINDVNGFTARVHTFAGTGNNISIARNRTYWFCFKWDAAANLATMKIYDPDTWILVGTSTLALENIACRLIAIGRFDDHQHAPAGSVHYVDDIVIDDTGNNFPIFPASAWVADDAGNANFGTVYTLASDGQAIIFPAATNTWTTGRSITKQLEIYGQGTGSNTTEINFTQTGSSDPPFDIRANWVWFHDIRLKGTAGLNDAQTVGIHAGQNGDWYRIKNILFLNCFTRIEGPFGVTYKCVFYNSDYMGRHAGVYGGGGNGQSLFDAYYPFNTSRTNLAVWEDCIYRTDNLHVKAQYVAISSQQAAQWMCRNCFIDCSQGQLAPCFDSHGGFSGSLGNIGAIIYSNKINASVDKALDQRGGASLTISNYFSSALGQGIYMRQSDDDPSFYFPPTGFGQVTNTLITFNYANNIYQNPVVEANDSSIIVLHKSYETNGSWTVPPYPFPVRDDSGAAPPPPPPVISGNPPPAALRTIRLGQ